jgi:transposase
MSTARSTRHRSRGKGRRRFELHKANGVLHPRVQAVGPDHFGLVCFDCAKARSKWILCDFYGKVLVEPTTVEHQRGQLAMAVALVNDCAQQHQLQDLVIAIERTGNYHLPVQRAFQAARFQDRPFDVRVVHPFATKQHRQPANPQDKTDDNDLAALFRATVAGFGLREPEQEPGHRQLQLIARHRRDLVQKRTAVCCQLREHLEAVLPGYAALFGEKFWESQVALPLAREVASPAEFAQQGVDGLSRLLRDRDTRFHSRTLEKIVAWAANAAAPDAAAATHHRIALVLDNDRLQKTREIQGLEQELALHLARTPYLLLLACPGVNVVSAAELAGEMGPIGNYARANCITGRAGLYRSRYQSDEIDLQNGPLVRMCNRRLRAALMMIADNLVTCNPHYRALAALWATKGQHPRSIRVKIATRFARLIFQLVAGRQILRHPGMRGRDAILDKLMKFHLEHGTSMTTLLSNLQDAVAQLPAGSHADEAAPLVAALEKAQTARRGVRPIGEILPLVLARLGVGVLQSDTAREPS